MASTLTTIKVSKEAHTRLMDVARQHGRTMSQTIEMLLAEHTQTVQAHLEELRANEARLAEIRRRRQQPLADAVRHDAVLDELLDEAN
jgi:antitoxin component of RelBE/YafQ-DinJ toxin-antitoxin module